MDKPDSTVVVVTYCHFSDLNQEDSSFDHNFQFHYINSRMLEPVYTKSVEIPVRNQKHHPELLLLKASNSSKM